MKPASFKYVEATDETALSAVLTEHGADARLLAGGQSLVPMMNFRIVAPEVLIDINRVDTLSYIDCDAETVRIGSLTRHAALEDSIDVARCCSLLSLAVRNVAHRAVRNRGTLGGTLALAYPGAEMPLALMTLGAEIRLISQRGERHLPMQDFVVGALETALADDEYIGGAEIRLPPANSVASFIETTRRHGDFAIGAAAVVIGCDDAGKLNYVRAGVSGGTGAPIRLMRFESILADLDSKGAVDEAIRDTIADIEVFGDHHYPEDYRRHVLGAVLQRALGDAIARSGACNVQ